MLYVDAATNIIMLVHVKLCSSYYTSCIYTPVACSYAYSKDILYPTLAPKEMKINIIYLLHGIKTIL